MEFPKPNFYLDLYEKLGLRIIPIYGANMPDGTFNEKKPGYPEWQKYISKREELLGCIGKSNWGIVCGDASENVFVMDFDLEVCMGSKEAARMWRKTHIQQLRELGTLICFTPSGGIHIYFRTKDSDPKPSIFANAVRDLMISDPRFVPDLIRGNGGMVLA